MFLPQSSEGDFAPPPSGTHFAVCFRVIDLGTQQTEWQGQAKLQRKVLLSWELPDEHMEDGRPFMVSQRYTFSSSEKARLRQHLEGWRGKRFTEADFGPGGFDIKNVLGKPCLLTLVHASKEGKTYANIAGVSAIPKGMEVKAGSLEQVYFSLERPRFDQAVLADLSEGLQQTIRSSPEYSSLVTPDPGEHRDYDASNFDRAPLDDEIPF